jgi:hypothetical protein
MRESSVTAPRCRCWAIFEHLTRGPLHGEPDWAASTLGLLNRESDEASLTARQSSDLRSDPDRDHTNGGGHVGENPIVEEFENGDYIVVLDGPVLEVFYGPRATSDRRHVKHISN